LKEVREVGVVLENNDVFRGVSVGFWDKGQCQGK
jgi:hypothetical protein